MRKDELRVYLKVSGSVDIKLVERRDAVDLLSRLGICPDMIHGEHLMNTIT